MVVTFKSGRGNSNEQPNISKLSCCVMIVVVFFGSIGFIQSNRVTSAYGRSVLLWIDEPQEQPEERVEGDISVVGYELAYEQSYGFFDDISNENWLIAQKLHSKTFPNYYQESALLKYANKITDLGNIKALSKSSWWNAENFQEEFHCSLAQRIPPDSGGDGPKWVCE